MTCFSKIFYHMFLESKKKKLKDLFSMVIGIQISVSGYFAKPLFNVVVRLGISLVIACYRSRPEPLLFSDDDGSLFDIIGFLIVGLTWALVMVPLK